MNKPDIKELLELAKKATPGPWEISEADDWMIPGIIGAYGCDPKNLKYIAALSPDKMIALLEYVEELEEALVVSKHTHVNNEKDDYCAECNLYLTHIVHRRVND